MTNLMIPEELAPLAKFLTGRSSQTHMCKDADIQQRPTCIDSKLSLESLHGSKLLWTSRTVPNRVVLGSTNTKPVCNYTDA